MGPWAWATPSEAWHPWSRPLRSSVAATSTSSGSIRQASARAWPVAVTKLASAAKVSRPPRTRACGEEVGGVVGSPSPTPATPGHPGVQPGSSPPLLPLGSAGPWLEQGSGGSRHRSYFWGALPLAGSLACSSSPWAPESWPLCAVPNAQKQSPLRDAGFRSPASSEGAPARTPGSKGPSPVPSATDTEPASPGLCVDLTPASALLPDGGREVPGLRAWVSGPAVPAACPHGRCCGVLWAGGGGQDGC